GQRIENRREPVERTQLLTEIHGHVLQQRDGFDLDKRSRGELCDLDGRPRRWMLADVRRVDLVHPREVVEALQEDRRLHDAVEAAPCFLEDRAEVGEDLIGLLLDRAAAQLRVSRLERELTGDEDKARSLDRLRV